MMRIDDNSRKGLNEHSGLTGRIQVWQLFQKHKFKSFSVLVLNKAVMYIHSFSGQPRQLTLFILVRATRAVAVARLQSVVSSGLAERNT